ncbi:MipA/OmpV family protein [Acidovorax lacteus]|uniref:MipA/OmpV family protein n=1 Tax=Acidovorax lacteus TaxID=1924988 RepID=A0ABP8L638_9BURK
MDPALRPVAQLGWACAVRSLWVLAAVPSMAMAQDPDRTQPSGVPAQAVSAPSDAAAAAPPVRLHYVLGGIASASPDYPGSERRGYGLRPAWAIEYGRFRLSTSRGSALMGHGLGGQESGASATLADGERFQLRAGLRIDQGRDGDESPRLVGLPEVRSTLRLRMSVGYEITRRWSVGLGVSQDLLGREGGGQASVSFGYALPLSDATRLSLGAGLHWADGTYMRTQYGVPTSAAGSSPLPAYIPKAGWYNADAGVEVMHALGRHWVALGGVRVSQLQGAARHSPLTVEPFGYSVSVGLAYRCCR